MRVFQAMAGAEFGGAEAFFVRLAIAFAKAGLEQKVAIRINEKRAQILRAGGVDTSEFRFGGRMDVATRMALRKELKAFRPDVVLTWMNRATSMCPPGTYVHVGRLGGYYDLKYYGSCDHLIGNTQDIVDYLVKEGWSEDRAHYLPNFVSGQSQPPVARKEFFTPENANVILALGRLHENKAFDTLMRAVARVPDTYLWLAGEGPLRSVLEDLAEELGIKPRVRFVGWRDDVPALFSSATLFVCPSRHEPLGNVVIEAWAQGLPVIATDSLGPGTLIDHMENGILVPVDDVLSLANAIRHVFADIPLSERIATAGRDTYERRFTETIVVDRYREFFDTITAKDK